MAGEGEGQAGRGKGVNPRIKYAVAIMIIAVASYVIVFNYLKSQQEPPLPGYEVYSGPGYTLLKPGAWNVRFLGNGSSIMLQSPPEQGGDYRENVIIDAGNTSLNLSAYVIQDLFILDRTLPGFRLEPHPGPGTINGNEAFNSVFTARDQSNLTYKFSRSYVKKDGMIFLITYAALNETYTKYLAELNVMLDSFTIR
ncbi:MAG: hypothetical protein HY367_03285 [Candidatus Aenigmarchaeota archaeon]|nr:hypothetical protein [Candidatus Aenigmarchaeota archaeon]